jgi:hypothetical protein
VRRSRSVVGERQRRLGQPKGQLDPPRQAAIGQLTTQVVTALSLLLPRFVSVHLRAAVNLKSAVPARGREGSTPSPGTRISCSAPSLTLRRRGRRGTKSVIAATQGATTCMKSRVHAPNDPQATSEGIHQRPRAGAAIAVESRVGGGPTLVYRSGPIYIRLSCIG